MNDEPIEDKEEAYKEQNAKLWDMITKYRGLITTQNNIIQQQQDLIATLKGK